jgi:hypothetical protein
VLTGEKTVLLSACITDRRKDERETKKKAPEKSRRETVAVQDITGNDQGFE